MSNALPGIAVPVTAESPELHKPDASAVRAGRLMILAAAVLWSTSGFFAKADWFADWPPGERGLLLAFWRAVFAGLFLLPMIRRPRWSPALVPMTLCFTGMNVTYLGAMTLTTAANAIWLQSTAPLWVTLLSFLFLRDRLGLPDLLLLACGLAGVGTILYFEAYGQAGWGIAQGLAAGVCYAGVVISMRALRQHDAVWLVAINHLVAALLMLPGILAIGRLPSPGQFAVLAVFGLVQMAIPYVLFARGLKTVLAPEATLIGLLEPILLPVWVYLAWGEVPAEWTIAGGGLILTGLILRYGRWKRSEPPKS